MLENGAIRGSNQPGERKHLPSAHIARIVPTTRLEMASFVDESGSPLEVECTTSSANRCQDC